MRFSLLLSSTLAIASSATAQDLPAALQRALKEQQVPASALSLWVQPVQAPLPRLAWQADTPRQMASLMKLFTTGVALRTLGPAFTWRTELALGGPLDAQGVLHGPLHIRASGDPSLDGTQLAAAMRQWRERGLQTIDGDVRVDKSVFALPPHDPGAFDGQALRPYNAGPDAWLLAHQAVSLLLSGEAGASGKARVGLSPSMAGVRLDAQVTLDPVAPCGAWREGLSIEITEPDTAGSRTLRLQGRYPAACGETSWPIQWPQARPGEHSARRFEAAWKESGGRLTGQVVEGAWPAGAVPWARWESPPLAQVVRDINKYSNNVMARQLFLTLARQPGEPATLERAREVVSEHVRLSTRPVGQAQGPCDHSPLVLDNGSGLSRHEVASARCLGAWLQVMWADPTMPEWLSSLPVAGVDGTARRMPSAVGQAHLKTGSLEGVTALAGIVHDARGQRQALVAVISHAAPAQARTVLQAVLAWAHEAP